MEQTLNRVSLVSLLDDLQLTLGTSEIPENAVLPLPWAIFALWKREESDAGKEFEQQCELVGPDGKRLLRGAIRFQLERPVHRTTINFPGLPISTVGGEYTLQLSLREVREGSEMRSIASFPFNITTTTT